MDKQKIVSINHSKDNDLKDVEVINEINYDGGQYLLVSTENTSSSVHSVNKNNMNENTESTSGGTTLFSSSSNSFTIREVDFDFESLHMLRYWSKEELVAYISKLMNWLIDCVQKTHLLESVTPNISRQIYYISCVLWLSQETSCDLSCILTVTIFNVLLDWTLSSLEPKYKLMKLAVDRVLCSMYAIQPDQFSNLLERLGIILPVVDTSTKDCNDVRHHQFKFLQIQQPCSDPYDISRLANGHSMNITENLLHTLSTISLCYTSSDQLISSGFLALLIDLVISFIEFDEETNEENTSGRQISKNPTIYLHPGFKIPELRDMNVYNKSSQPVTFRSHLSSLKGVKSKMFFSLRNISRTSFPTGTAYLKSPLAKQDKHADVSASKSKLEDDSTKAVLDLESCSKDKENDLTLPKEDAIVENTVLNSDTISAILIFFSELSWQNCIKTWLGSENICVFWRRLLRYLCITIPLNKTDCKYLLKNKMTKNSVLKLEDAAITFFRKCCSCHPRNQQKFAQILYNILTQMTSSCGLMDFTRRILLELVVDIDSVNMYVETDEENIFGIPAFDESFLLPPAFPLSTKHRMFYFRTDYTCSDIIKQILINNSSSSAVEDGSSSTPKRSAELEVGSTFEVIKKIKLTNEFQISKEDLEAAGSSKDEVVQRVHPKLLFWSPTDNQYIKLSQSSKIVDILRIFVPSGDELDVPVLKCYVSRYCDADNDEICLSSDYKIPPTMVFREFVELRGVELIVYYIEVKPQKVILGSTSMRNRVHSWNKMPIHSLIAFGLFLRLPEYRNLNQVRRILRFVYGFDEEAIFNLEKYSDCFLSDNPSMLLRPLGVLPYELLGHCFKENTSRLDENSRLFVSTNFLLLYLALCTHQPESVLSTFIETEDEVIKTAIQQCFSSVGNLLKRKNPNTLNYWPGRDEYNSISAYTNTGSDIMFLTMPISEIIEEEEELVTSLIQALTMYINPCPKHYSKPYSNFDQIELPAAFIDLTKKSCLRKVLVSYLRNESVLDIFRRIPLYKAIMQILRVIVANSQTVNILICDEKAEDSPVEDSDPVSIVELILKMKTCVEVYTEQLSKKFVENQCSSASKLESDEKDLILDIQNTATFIDTTIRNLRSLKKSVPHTTTASTLEVPSVLPKKLLYTKMMKKLQFATFDMITETEEGNIEFNVDYHYCDLVLNINPVTTPVRMKRLAQEVVSLRSSLPLSYESTIFVRCDTDRLDVIKVLITGPLDTPYMNGCFEFDVCFPANYPNTPMLINLRTTGRNSVRFNPNLYECGKVCLSLLNTWSGRTQDMWNPSTSNLIQVLISIQALVFVAQPYFNEPGLERQNLDCEEMSKDYNDRLMPHTIRWAMTDQIQNPSPCFKDVIHAHFWAKTEEIKQQITKWINESNAKYTDQIRIEAMKLFAVLEQLSEPDTEF